MSKDMFQMSKTIWIAERGSYSDKEIVGVFSAKQKAKDSGVDYDDLTEYFVDLPYHTPQYVVVTILKDGNIVMLKTMESLTVLEDTRLWVTPPVGFRGDGSSQALEVYVHTTDSAKAIKVANEIRSRIVALCLWGLSEGLSFA